MRWNRGFTLVEIMLAMALCGLVIVLALQIGLSMTQGLESQRDALALERSARHALDVVSAAARDAVVGVPNGDARDVAGCTPIVGIGVVNSNAAPDELTVIHGAGGVATATRSQLDGATVAFDIVATPELAVGDHLLVADGENAGRLVEIDALAPSGPGDQSVTIVAPQAACPAVPMPVFPARSLAVRARVTRFFVATVGDVRSLMMDRDGSGPREPQPVADDIEDLQIAIGVDGNGDGQIAEVGLGPGDDEWHYNVAGEAGPPPISAAWRAIRITVIARDPRTATGDVGAARPAVEDHAAGAADGYRRRVLSTITTIRNLESP